jgi:hypothetical protein
MRVKNYTTLETAWLRRAIVAVQPSNVTGFDITFKNSSNVNKGRAYPSGTSYHDRSCQLITVGIRASTRFPYRTMTGNGYLGCELYSLREVVVFIVAHELRHLWQKKVPKGWRVWGARGQYSERDADAYAIAAVRRYRRGELDC